MKVSVQVYDNLKIDIIVNEKKDGYTFKTPKGFGGRYYYSFCNDLDDAFCEQYPFLADEIHFNLRNN